MTVGVTATEANTLLTSHIGRALYVKLHTADPGVAGATAASAETTRKALTWDTPSAASVAIVATFPSWASWSAGSETLTHISLWTAATDGTFVRSYQLTAPKAVTDGDTVTLSSLTATFTPIAA